MTAITPENRCVPVAEWPENDRLAWERALLPYDPLDGVVNRANRWRPATVNLTAGGYGRWLGWLILTDQLDPDAGAGERATKDRVKAYLEALKATGLADYSVSSRIKQLADALSAIEPAGDFVWIARAAARLHAAAQPVRNVLEVMQPPQEVLQLGQELMDAAEKDKFRTACERATLFRDGLLLSFVTLRPLRMANLASLEIGRHLDERNGWRIHIQGEETKNGGDIDALWPESLSAALERYLSTHRPTLMRTAKGDARHCPALWISRQGGRMTNDAISMQIKLRTREEFGKAINPHAFRHIAATAIATFHPEEAVTIKDVLGHGTMRTAEKYYNRAETLGAGERLQATVADLRKGKRPPNEVRD